MRVASRRRTAPASWLTENACLLPQQGRALDIAMGMGRNSLFLAGLGLEVEGVDNSPDSLAAAMEMADEAGLHLKATLGDLEDGAFRLPPNFYDVVVCINYLFRPLVPSIIACLRPAGLVIYETYLVDMEPLSQPHNPDHLLRHNELLDLFRGLRVLRYHEGESDALGARAGLVAQKA